VESQLVSVLITTYNSSRYLQRCLESIASQSYPHVEAIIVDNASADGTREMLASSPLEATAVYNQTNRGFAAAQNQAIRAAKGTWLLSLNPDVVLDRNFISELVRAGELDSSIGCVCGKLLRWHAGATSEFSSTIDSTGIYFTPNLRHLDRGAEENDTGRYEKLQYVFGATGAAALYRRQMVDDVSVEGEFFDEQFFAYREDADVAWRAQLMGWKCVYTPKAIAWHVRRVTPERREQLPTAINWHSIKNRFLMRAKNIAWPLYLRFFVPITFRDLQVVAYCAFVDRRLFSALTEFWKMRHDLARKRRQIQSHRRITDRHLFKWFSNRPTSAPFEEPKDLQGRRTIPGPEPAIRR
jgi:GT2 family glycosyltransferase